MELQLHSGQVRATLVPHIVTDGFSQDMMLVLDSRSADLKCVPKARANEAVKLLSLREDLCSRLSMFCADHVRQCLSMRDDWAEIQGRLERRLAQQGYTVRWLDAHLFPINPQAVKQWF